MRQFILAGAGAAPTDDTTTIDKLADGAVSFFYMKDGVPTADAKGTHLKGYGSIVLGRKSNGPVVLPFYLKDFSYSKMEYAAATTFDANFTVANVVEKSDHTVIFVKKGKNFNERSKWTATVHAKTSAVTVAEIAKQIAKYVNDNTLTLGLTATPSEGKVTVKATEAGQDYEIVMADSLYGVTVTYTTHGMKGFGDAADVRNFAIQAGADAGFRDTYQDSVQLLYPNYPLNPLAQPDAKDTGFTVFTLRFAVPRQTKTRDEVVHQIVQIAFPTSAPSMTTFEATCKAFVDPTTAALPAAASVDPLKKE